jgi:putative endonuclease
MDKSFFIYILCNKRNGTLYVGVTSDLVKRIWQHKEGLADGFTKKYGIKTLVYYEPHGNSESAIHREKSLKEWKRKWKLNLIERFNPYWIDLYPEIL